MNNTIMNTKKLVIMAMFSAIAYLAAFLQIPAVAFLSYEPKDAIIVIGGFILGPLAALVITLLTCFVEMVTISETGWIGLLMNFISTAAFTGVASFIYFKKKSIFTMIIGLISGSIFMTILMLMWNYIITPFYMGVPRDVVAEMIFPVLLPFNLIKSGINSALSVMIFIPLTKALEKSKLFTGINNLSENKNMIILYSISSFVLLTCIAFILVQ